jgi:hypothetical protein
VSIALAAIAVALAVFLFFIDSGRVTTGEAEARKRNIFKAYRRAELSEIVVQKKDEAFHISRRVDDGGDSMFYLDGELADQPAVDKLLGVLEFATPERRIDDPSKAISRHEMGLDAPRLRVSITMGALQYHLDVGDPAPVPQGAAYAQLEGEGLMVVPRDLVTELTHPRDAYRARTLVPYLSSSLAEIALDGAGGPRRFVEAPWGGWAVLVDGQKVRADRDAFDALLAAFADLRAESFVNDADADKALAAAENKIHLTMVPKSGARAVLDVGGVCAGQADDVVAVRLEPAPRQSACVPKGVMGPLSSPMTALVDRHVFSLRSDETEEILLTAGDKKLDVARVGTGWHQRAPIEGVVDNDSGQGLAHALHDLVGEDVVVEPSLDKLDLAPPRGSAALSQAGGTDGAGRVETVEVATKGPDGAVYVRRKVDGAVLKLSRESASVLVPSTFSLRSLKLIDEPVGQVHRVAVDGGGVRWVLRRASTGEVSLEEPKSMSTDAGVASQVIDVLASLRAERWVADADDGSFGLAEPRAHYELEVGSKKLRIEVGRATSGGAFARIADQAGVFILSQATLRTIETWPIDRSFFIIEPKDVRQIRLGDAVLSGDKLEAAKSILSSARAEGAVHLGAPRKEEGLDKPLLVLSVDVAHEGAPAPSTIKLTVGRGDVWRDTSIFYMRRAGIDATFAMAQSKVRPLLDLKGTSQGAGTVKN